MSASPSADQRLENLNIWLTKIAPDYDIITDSISAASSDASFRRYFRVQTRDLGRPSLIIMDAPPQHEDCGPFIDIAERLAAVDLNVPRILERNLQQGYLLLTDLGQLTYFQRLQSPIDDVELQSIYLDALDALTIMQTAPHADLPIYDEARILAELDLFEQWYVEQHCQDSLSDAEKSDLQRVFQLLCRSITAESYVFVHRDYHSPNLMLCTEPAHGTNPGVIDFQDAVSGPISYDLASTVMDARHTWEEPRQLDWAIRYWEKARARSLPVPDDFAVFHQQYEIMSLQRNLRIAGVFARLALQHNKPGYLNHMPRVIKYIRQVAQRYSDFRPLLRILDRLQNVEYKTGLSF